MHIEHGYRRILALDLMSVTGWACRSDDGQIMHGTETFEGKQKQSEGMRFMKFRNWLRAMYEELQPEFIYFEEVVGFPPKNRGRDAKIYYGFESHLLSFCAAAQKNGLNLAYHGVPVGTIKKFIAGSGNATKEAVVNAVKVLGHCPANHNEADAIALLLLSETLAEKKDGLGHLGRQASQKETRERQRAEPRPSRVRHQARSG